MKRKVLFLIIFVSVILYAFGNMAYSFFNVGIITDDVLNVSVSFPGGNLPVFTASSDENISLIVTDADMLVTSENTPAATKRGSVNIYLDGTNVEENSSVTCTFDLVYEDIEGNSYNKYVPSPAAKANNLLEYGISIIEEDGTVVLKETSVDSFKAGDSMVKGLSVSTTENTINKKYIVIATIYNLNVEQNIKNKKYGFKIKTTNVECQVTK